MAKNSTEHAEFVPAGNQTVTIRLPRIRGEADEMFVSVNEKTYLIRRGETVTVPKNVAKVIERHERAAEERMNFEAEHRAD